VILTISAEPLQRNNVDFLSLVGKAAQRFQVEALAGHDVRNIHVMQGRNDSVDTYGHRTVDMTRHETQ
jgi:hypothetical protein